MSELILGKALQEIADILYACSSENETPTVYSNPAYARLSDESKELYREIRELLPEEHKDKLSRFLDAETDMGCLYSEAEYRKGFIDGMAVMQVFMHLMNRQPVNNEISRLLDQYYHGGHLMIDGLNITEEMLRLMKITVGEKAQLNLAAINTCLGRAQSYGVEV